jgi:hypothetical protein
MGQSAIPRQQASDVHAVKQGQSVGTELFVAEATDQRLRLVRHWQFELTLAVAGVALFAVLVLRHRSQSTAPVAW